MAQQYKLGNVHFLGMRRDVADLLQQADLFVLPSVYDIFPTVLLEAMAASLPIVATDVGGVPEMLNGANGLLVPPQDELALQKAITSIFEQNYKLMGEEGYSLLQQSFTREQYVKRTTEVYEELLNIG